VPDINGKLLARLHCPYCGSGLVVDMGVDNPASARFSGVLRCACYRYPVLDGIPILRQASPVGTNRDPIVELILKGDIAGAIAAATRPLQTQPLQSTGRLRRAISCMRSLVSGSVESAAPQPLWSENAFRETLYALKPRSFADYLYYRHANNSFMSATILICLLRELGATQATAVAGSNGRPTIVLDLCCGIGHTSFLIGALFSNLTVIAVDGDFGILRVAQRYICPQAMQVCLDAELPLPFADDAFDACLGLDGLHYLRSKVAILKELDRVLRRDSLWLFPHMHNALQSNVAPGVPLSPDGWERLLEFIPHRIVPESTLIHGFANDDACDLGPVASLALLNGSPSLASVATRREGAWCRHEGLSAVLTAPPGLLAFNPIFEVDTSGAGARLTARWPSNALREECALARTVLPDELILDERQVSRAGLSGVTPSVPSSLRELARRFVVVGLPPGYRRAAVAGHVTRPRT